MSNKSVSDKPLAESGEQNRVFGLGAQRDSAGGKGTPVLISPYFLNRLAIHLEKGAKKYAKRNWELGMPLSEYLNSLLRHTLALMMGKDDEDHEAAIAFNIMAYTQTKELIDKGLLPETMNDMVDYEKLNTVDEYIAKLKIISGECTK